MNHVDYLGKAFDSKTLIKEAEEWMPAMYALVGRGLSGSLAIPVLAYHFDLPFGIVRKPDYSSHSMNRLEANFKQDVPWIFVDDSVCSGITFNEVERVMKDNDYLPCSGIYYYNNHTFRGIR